MEMEKRITPLLFGAILLFQALTCILIVTLVFFDARKIQPADVFKKLDSLETRIAAIETDTRPRDVAVKIDELKKLILEEIAKK